MYARRCVGTLMPPHGAVVGPTVHFIAGVRALGFPIALKLAKDALAVLAFEVLIIGTSAIHFIGLIAAIVHVIAAQIRGDATLVEALEIEEGTLTESYKQTEQFFILKGFLNTLRVNLLTTISRIFICSVHTMWYTITR